MKPLEIPTMDMENKEVLRRIEVHSVLPGQARPLYRLPSCPILRPSRPRSTALHVQSAVSPHGSTHTRRQPSTRPQPKGDRARSAAIRLGR